MSATAPRRWNGFVCPTCRSLFRVASNHDGRGVVCPTCHSMLRLPAEGEDTPPLVVKELARRRRSRQDGRRDKRAEAIFDETFADKSGPDPIIGRILMASVVTVVMAVAVGLFWPRGGSPSDPLGDELPVRVDPLSEDIQPLPETKSGFASIELVRDELEPVVRAFLDAPDLESAAKLTTRPERTLERMKAHYGDGYRPVGLGAVLWSQSMTLGSQWASFRVETGDFDRRTVFLVRDDGWKVDWDSWVGWSAMSWEQLREEMPTEPVRIRALVRAVEYYNFRFSSESDWASLLLTSPDQNQSIYGYVPRASELYSRMPFLNDAPERYLILEIRYPKNAPIDNQVLIEDIVGENWLDTEDLP